MNRFVASAALLGSAGCFSPQPPAGAPCSAAGTCPAPLVCDPATTTCVAPPSDAGPDGIIPDPDPDAADGPLVDAARTCWDQWVSPDEAPAIDSRVPVPGVPTAMHQLDPETTRDGLGLYFTQLAGPTSPGGVTTFMQRPTPDAAYGDPQTFANLADTDGNSRLTINTDGTEAYLASRRGGAAIGNEIYRVTRTAGAADFSVPDRNKLDRVNTADQELDPELTADGLHLYFSRVTGGAQRIYVSARQELDKNFQEPVEVVLPTGATFTADPTLSPDERVLLFAAIVQPGASDIFYATRATPGDPFTVRGLVPTINTLAQSEGDPEISADGCEIYFSATGQDGTQTALPRDLYLARVRRQ